MKTTVSAGLGGRNFIIDQDAYDCLKSYLENYEKTLVCNKKEILEEVEMRIADLFKEELNGREVVNIELVRRVASRIGLPESSSAARGQRNPDYRQSAPVRKFFLNPDDKMIAGVCGGLAAYFNIDVVLIRILAVLLLIAGVGIGFWGYIIIWIIAPTAYSAIEKCQLRGLECTAENISKFKNTVR